MSCDKCNHNNDTERDCTTDIGRGCHFCNGGEEATATACPGCFKLHAYDWAEGLPEVFPDDIFEVRFKNTRKSYYRNVNNLPLKTGDIVAVEASPGHDIGIVSMTGDLVARQMKRVGFNPLNGEFKKIYRKAKPYDIEKWQEAIALEHRTMIRSRQIAADLGLNMKIGDVEYQGDKIKAIFYYIADERVDFRELIKIFADQFRIRVEMKQIGARQEAGRIGGLGSCGRELCCASWISSFVSVTTNSARHQEISLNPQKLAGQCGKLKCCLVYELDTYLDARKEFPRVNQPLQALDGDYHLIKIDILSRTMYFSTDPHSMANMQALHVSRVKEILALNHKGQKVESIQGQVAVKVEEPGFADVVGEESLTRFDKEGKRRKGRGGRNRGAKGGEQNDNNARGGEGGKAPNGAQSRQNGEGQQNKPRGNGQGRQRPDNNRRDAKPRNDKPAEGERRENRPPRPEGERSGGNSNRRRGGRNQRGGQSRNGNGGGENPNRGSAPRPNNKPSDE